MEQTVARRHLRQLTSQSDSAIERYSKLKAKIEPSKEDQISRITARYNRLLLKPANQNVDTWLGEWEDVMSKYNHLRMTNLTREDGTRTFLTVLRRLDQMYAEIRLNELRKDRSLDVFDEIHYFQKQWRSLNQKEQKSAFTTFKG
jgi:murein DD-endopeptidase MepM/ murein hydrolase activator NlpD